MRRSMSLCDPTRRRERPTAIMSPWRRIRTWTSSPLTFRAVGAFQVGGDDLVAVVLELEVIPADPLVVQLDRIAVLAADRHRRGHVFKHTAAVGAMQDAESDQSHVVYARGRGPLWRVMPRLRPPGRSSSVKDTRQIRRRLDSGWLLARLRMPTTVDPAAKPVRLEVRTRSSMDRASVFGTEVAGSSPAGCISNRLFSTAFRREAMRQFRRPVKNP